jgi:hypothetical protein
MMDGVLSPVLHTKVPVALVDKIELPQLFATFTTGADGIAKGAAMPAPATLVQPPTV